MGTLVRELFDGPLDIVGDIHGELGALEDLLARLGYDAEGRHPEGRRLVFVGDLIDRGDDSPGVVERVAEMVEAGRAQCVLGNHEMNLLRDDRKAGNGWFQPEEDDHDIAKGRRMGSRRATDAQRCFILDWLGTLPVALERPDLRVVHACWHDAHIQCLRAEHRPAAEAFDALEREVEARLTAEGVYAARDAELAAWEHKLDDPDHPPPLLEALARSDATHQTAHPLRVVTSGIERPTTEPFFASGKWRMVERVAWWHDYDDEAAVVMGHYWRSPVQRGETPGGARGPDLFAGTPPLHWLGPARKVMCIDWCAGNRPHERRHGKPYLGQLGALRFDTGEIVFDR